MKPTRNPPAEIDGVNVQRIPQDAAERTLQLQAWAVWWAENPPRDASERYCRACAIAELSGKPAPNLLAYDL